MNNLLDQTLAQIVTSDHRAALVFEKYHLDFCCKGKRSLLTACQEKSLPADQILNELNNVLSNGRNESSLLDYVSLSQLCDYIVATHHSYVQSSIPLIETYLEKVVRKHGDRYPYMQEVLILFTRLGDELTEHMFKEEKILFPRIKELESKADNLNGAPSLSYIEMPISVMEHEHDSAGNILEQIRQLTNGFIPPSDACTTHRVTLSSLQAFEANLHQHVHLENNILFPKATNLIRKLNHQSTN